MKDFITVGILIGATIYSAANTIQAIYTTGKYIEETETSQQITLKTPDFALKVEHGKCIMVRKQEARRE